MKMWKHQEEYLIRMDPPTAVMPPYKSGSSNENFDILCFDGMPANRRMPLNKEGDKHVALF